LRGDLIPPPGRRFDSEEEALRARQAGDAQRREVRREAAEATRRLDEFRAARRAAADVRECARRANLLEGGGAGGRDDPQKPLGAADEAALEAAAAAVAAHERRWAALEAAAAAASPPPRLGLANVPWPPLGGGAEYLAAAAATLAAGDGSRSAAPPKRAALKKAYARACLRWHPDKFERRWGSALAPGEARAVLERAAGAAAALTAGWAALEAGA
jgi:hypothetical protein